MGVFSGYRPLNESYSTVEAPEPDMSYSGVDGANRILAENAINDRIMFEAIIKNDISQAYCEHAIREGAYGAEEQLYALQEAAGGGIWSKIKEFLKKIWAKITGLIKSFMIKLTGSVAKDTAALVKKYSQSVSRNMASQRYKDMKFKWSDLKRKDYDYNKELTTESTVQDVERLIGITCDEAGKYKVTRYLKDGDTETKNFGKAIDDFRERLDDDDFIERYTKEFIVEESVDTLGEIPGACHKYFFEDEETKEGEFSKYVDHIKDVLSNHDKSTKTVTDNQKKLDKFFSKQIKQVEKLESLLTAAKPDKEKLDLGVSHNRDAKSRIRYDDNRLYQHDDYIKDGKPEKGGLGDSDGTRVNGVTLFARAASVTRDCYSKCSSIMTSLINGQLEAIKYDVKQCRRVWVQAASLAARGESADMIDIIGESADYETDQLFV